MFTKALLAAVHNKHVIAAARDFWSSRSQRRGGPAIIVRNEHIACRMFFDSSRAGTFLAMGGVKRAFASGDTIWEMRIMWLP
eukprot:790700-Pleurochrysis_carterae.AAC.1